MGRLFSSGTDNVRPDVPTASKVVAGTALIIGMRVAEAGVGVDVTK
jgi:4-aminobutyrate aminotransferase-like enzyme